MLKIKTFSYTNGLQNSDYNKRLLCSSAILRLLTDGDRMRSFSVTMAYVFVEMFDERRVYIYRYRSQRFTLG